jgi:MFS transporter, DHA1 family, tetracycline resistance protein
MKNYPLLTLFFVVATELVGFGLVIPILPQVALEFGSKGISLGLLLGAYSIAQFFAAPLLGTLSDRFGRKPVLMVSQVGTVLSYVLLAHATTYWGFLFARLLDGFTGGNIAVARAYVTDVTPEKDRAKGMATIGIAFGLGFILGPALGSIVYHFADFKMSALVAGGLSAAALVLTFLIISEPEKRLERKPFRLSSWFSALNRPDIRPLLTIQFIFFTLFSGMEITFALFTTTMFGFTEHQNSLLFLYIGLVILLVQGAINRKSDTALGQKVMVGIALTGLGVVGISLSFYWQILLVALAILAVGGALVTAYLPSWVSTKANSGQQGEIMGFYESTNSLGRMIGPIFTSTVFFLAYRWTYVGFGVVLFALAVWVWAKNRVVPK